MKRLFLIGIWSVSTLLSAQGLAEAATLAQEETAAPAPFAPWIYVNPNRFGTAVGAPWNQISSAGNTTGLAATNLLNASSVATTVDINITVAATEQFYNSPGSTGNNSGVYPDNAQSRGWATSAPFTFRLEQLTPSTEYKIDFFATLHSYHGSSASYTVNGVSGIYSGLASNTSTLYSVETTSDASGIITITIAPDGGGTYASVCAFVISKR